MTNLNKTKRAVGVTGKTRTGLSPTMVNTNSPATNKPEWEDKLKKFLHYSYDDLSGGEGLDFHTYDAWKRFITTILHQQKIEILEKIEKLRAIKWSDDNFDPWYWNEIIDQIIHIIKKYE